MNQKKKSDVAVLLDYAGSHKGLTFLGLALSAVSMLLSMAPYRRMVELQSESAQWRLNGAEA